MERLFSAVGWLAGTLGVLLMVVAAGARLAGHYWLAQFTTGSVLLGGMAAMIFGCLGFLAALTWGRGSANR